MRVTARLIVAVILGAWLGGVSAQVEMSRPEALSLLVEGGFDDKAQAIEALAATPDDATAQLLQLLLDGDLYYVKNSNRVVTVTRDDGGYLARDALDGTDAGSHGRRDVKKITINNTLRGQLREAIAGLDLRHPDPARRLAAVREMTGAVDADTATMLQHLVDTEADATVREAMLLAVAMQALDDADAQRRAMAVALLEESDLPAVRTRLIEVRDRTDEREYRERLERGIEQIDTRRYWYALFEKIFFGLSLGSVLVLAAIGLAITFGVMGVINMAHGELIMLGAYTTWVVQQLLPGYPGVALVASIPLAFLVAGLVGIGIERGVIRFLYGRPLETLLATFGISLVLQQAVRSIFSPLNRSVTTPDWLSGSLQINEVLSLTMNRLVIIGFCLAVFALLSLVLRYTALGLQVRAVSQNRDMARAMGVRSSRVDALTFGLGSGIAGIAGVALSQLTNVGPNLGQAYIIDSFMVVVFGGVGNLWGTLVGGMSLGVVNKFLEPWAGAVLAKILVLVLLILFIQKRPRGLFPQRGRAAEA